jgi:glycosyltransferase involved in cell wall biosynthesis
VAMRLVGPRWRPAPWESTVIDDIADNRPWNVLVKVLRLGALVRLRVGRIRPGTTVVVVNWNTGPLLETVLPLLIASVPPATRLLVVDNGSTDGSLSILRRFQPRVKKLRLPGNAGHAIALDIAALVCGTTTLVTVDSDAFPTRSDWLDRLLAGFEKEGTVACGLRASRGFVHPVLMAVDVPVFVREKLSFQVHQIRPTTEADDLKWGSERWDTAEQLSVRVGMARLGFLDARPSPDPELPGMMVDDIVYHHGGMSRVANGQLDPGAIAGFEDARDRLVAPDLIERARVV